MRPEILNPLFTSIEHIKGVGPKLTKSLSLLTGTGEEDARIIDLLFHTPFAVLSRIQANEISSLEPDMRVIIEVLILQHNPPNRAGNRPYKITVTDGEDVMELVFFNGDGRYLNFTYPQGKSVVIAGRVQRYNDRFQMMHPEMVKLPEKRHEIPLIEPIYPLTKGVTRHKLQSIIKEAIDVVPELPEWISAPLLDKYKWPNWQEAIKRIHLPEQPRDLETDSTYLERLAYDEIFANQLALALSRRQEVAQKGRSQTSKQNYSKELLSTLPFQPTQAQLRAVEDIISDMASEEAMLRLLQGDVGSGKTLVALLSALNAIEAGYQVAFMAPTEILAHQHYHSIRSLLGDMEINIALLTGSLKQSEKKHILSETASGKIDLLIGTHALFQNKVSFKDLSLAIVDEQHRFGVMQRLALTQKGEAADVLMLTATPIPRSLVMAYFGDIETSILDEKPAGRKDIETRMISESRLDAVINRLKAALDEGRQAYWICPLVEPSQELEAISVSERFEVLKNIIPHEMALLHGQMNDLDKREAMQCFEEGKARLLIATTVVEVGVDVPNASIMIIENAERFGLSQLHQLRGRVGRGDIRSSCLLIHSDKLSETSQKRLQIMCQTEDGFLIAEEDLKIRGEGEVLGRKQSGQSVTKFADFSAHHHLVEIARSDVKYLFETDPKLTSERGKALQHLLYLFDHNKSISLIRAG